MSLDKLAIIFFIIVLPISLVLNSYTKGELETLNLQISYDNKLSNATYDAVKAFQLNTLKDENSDYANSKMKDIEASVNAFFNSMSRNFNVTGYNTETLQEYVPALVYTMYDGYYIYSAYQNTLQPEDEGATYKNNQKLYGLKPYIYYSCEYKDYPQLGDDFVITYSLDNYITIQGKINGIEGVSESGYVIDIEPTDYVLSYNSGTITYRNVTIPQQESILQENLIKQDGDKKTYEYHKINGVKYYLGEDGWFSIYNGSEILYGYGFNSNYDMSAYNYYKEAYDFTKWLDDHGIMDLNTNNASDSELRTNKRIFDGDVENPDSNFNQHRLAVIRHAIEKNLSIAIANYNNYTDVKTNFLMPELKEDEWDKILNNISIISFMQGLNIGNKVYNGYAIVTNNNNEEVVSENSIYIANTTDNTYYNVLNKDWEGDISSPSNYVGIFNMDLRRKTKETTNGTKYYYPKLYYADYSTVIYQTKVANLPDGNIYKYLDGKRNLAKIYYTALGRERYGMYKANRDVDELLKKYQEN